MANDKKGKAFRKPKLGKQVTKCDEELIEKICNYLRLGCFLETAVAMSDVGRTTFHSWMKASHSPDHPKYKPIYARLRIAVDKAMEEATIRDLQNIDKCAMGEEPKYMRDEDGGIIFDEKGRPIILKPGMSPNWGASAWRLERRSKQWNRTEKIDATSSDGSFTAQERTIKIEFVGTRNKEDGE
jgi:hypothetical protein